MKRPSHPHTAPVKPSGRRHICVRIGLDGKLGRCAQEGVLVAAHVRRQLRQVLAGPRPWHQRRRYATARAAAAVAGFRAQAEHGVQPWRAAAVGRAAERPQWVGQQKGRSGSSSQRTAVGWAALTGVATSRPARNVGVRPQPASSRQCRPPTFSSKCLSPAQAALQRQSSFSSQQSSLPMSSL